MAIDWIGSFKTIPWTKVLSAAPTVVDSARKLWSSVGSKAAGALKPEPPQQKAYSPDPTISSVEKQIHALGLRIDQLGGEMVLTSELIDKLAEQQSQLVQAVDVLRVRTRALLWICVLLAMAVLVLIFLVAGR